MPIDTVYFLGAGATKAASDNAPLNNDLVKKALEHFPHTQEAKGLLEFITKLFHGRQSPPIDNQVWNLLDYIIQSGKDGSHEYSSERIEILREGLLRLAVREFVQSLMDANTELHRKFATAVKDSASVIISTTTTFLSTIDLLNSNQLTMEQH